MAQGHFIISPTENRKDIRSQMDPAVTGDPPDEQATLLNDVDRTVRQLRLIFADRDADFSRYYEPLLSLAQGGLVGPHAQPPIALRALAELKREVVDREAGRVKNAYMLSLGKAAAWVAIPSFVVGLAARALGTFPSLTSVHGVMPADIVANTLFLVSACAAGVWLSFGARKAILSFEDLAVPEQDHLLPMVRIAFAELVTVSLALLFHIGAIEVKLGSLSTADVFQKPLAAGIVGVLAGFSEQVISRTLASQASRLFK